jgi:hypothetical protein
VARRGDGVPATGPHLSERGFAYDELNAARGARLGVPDRRYARRLERCAA